VLQVNQDIELQINSTEPMKYFSYQVIGRGDVVVANTIQVSNKKTHKFRFLATYVMAPTAHVVVFYVKDDGEVVADAIDVELEGSLQNFVSLCNFSSDKKTMNMRKLLVASNDIRFSLSAVSFVSLLCRKN
jgi:hypothetical protein